MCKEYERATRRSLLHLGLLWARGADIGRKEGAPTRLPTWSLCLIIQFYRCREITEVSVRNLNP